MVSDIPAHFIAVPLPVKDLLYFAPSAKAIAIARHLPTAVTCAIILDGTANEGEEAIV